MTPAVTVAAMVVLFGCGGDAPGPQDGGAVDAPLDAGASDGGAPDGAPPWQDAAQDATADTFDAAGAYCEECEDGCDVELSVELYNPWFGDDIQCWEFSYHAMVCNGGSKDTARAEQVVRFETDDMHLCDASTSEPLTPGMCITVSCREDREEGGEWASVGDTVYATLDPDDPEPSCADPDDRTDEAPIWLCVH